tara:strand:+ start:455 stop:1234 length:780 start_codon:yes stop_codon:yes gene_type:complete
MKIQSVISYIESSQTELVNHNIYSKISTIEDLKIFMENHIYAVWDFMSLLKALQVNLTCTKNPWTPSKNTQAARFINEIVLEEETDEIKNGKVISHFELYLQAMDQIGASTSKINDFINKIETSNNYRDFINNYDINQEIKEFLNFTFDVIESGETHKIAAAFTFGRENVIPDMFIEIVKGLNKENSNVASDFIYYLERHIELDGDDHGPIALKMIENLCGNNQKKWEEVKEISKKSIDMRIRLWSHISSQIEHEYSNN